MNPARFLYYRTMARLMGVPPLWIDDAAQDIAITVWRRGDDGAGTVRSAAIDAARRYGPVSRVGRDRRTVPLEDVRLAADDRSHVIDELIDARRAIAKMPRRLRRALASAIAGDARTNAEMVAVGQARRRLRTLAA